MSTSTSPYYKVNEKEAKWLFFLEIIDCYVMLQQNRDFPPIGESDALHH